MPRFIKANVDRDELFYTMLKVAKRNVSDITEDDNLDRIVGAAIYHCPKDLDKVSFDTENVRFESFGNIHGSDVCWAYAGGDWEYPVYFIIYIDDKNKLRFYIPEDGNTYCHKCKHAYGSCECNMDTNWDDDTAENILGMFDEEDNVYEHKGEEDFVAMERDAEARLQIKEGDN